MPLYEYECLSCADTFEITHSIADLYEREAMCPKCGLWGRANLQLVFDHRQVEAPWSPHWNFGMGAYVGSRSEYKKLLKEKGLREYGSSENPDDRPDSYSS